VFGFLARVAIRGDSNLCPFGMPMAACISFPFIFLRSPKRMWVVRRIALSCVVILVILSCGSCMQRVMPSNSHPRISFRVDHSPSPCCNFFMEIGSSVGLSVGPGGGKMVCIA